MRKILIYGLGVILTLLFTHCTTENKEYTFNKGQVYGTYYSITYLHPRKADLKQQIEEKFSEFDNSLSTFNPNSIISRINRNDTTVLTDAYFESMYNAARQVSEKSGGAFDITVAPLVNAWGFGFGNHEHTDVPRVDSILPFVGYTLITLKEGRLIKKDPRTMLDASAIAKGQSCDVIGRLLEENGCVNYMVEIGGEVMCKGLNPKGEKWHIGIDKPADDPANEDGELQAILALSDAGLATSGNYRQYYYRDGKKYAHTIEPRTGYPVNHNLLSATVVAPTCMQADAYATAFMVLGADSSMLLCNSIPGMDCYLIYQGDKGELHTTYTPGFARYFTETDR